jgi:hypothetical protein
MTTESQKANQMNEQRAFTVVVTGCSNCPHFADEFGACFKAMPTTGFGTKKQRKLVDENYKAITPSCPMWPAAKPIGELK